MFKIYLRPCLEEPNWYIKQKDGPPNIDRSLKTFLPWYDLFFCRFNLCEIWLFIFKQSCCETLKIIAY